MTKHYDLDRGSVFIFPVPDALMEFTGAGAPSLNLTLLNATTVQAVAGTGNDQQAVAVNGLWRYRSATVSATITPSAGAGVYDVYVTASNNAIVPGDSVTATVDTTDYNFGLQIKPSATTPTGVDQYRKVGEVDCDGSVITAIRQLAGRRDNTPIVPTAPLVSISPVRARGINGQTAPLAVFEDYLLDAKVSITTSGITLGAGSSIISTQSSAANTTWATKVTGDSNNRFAVGADGKLSWGSGAASSDVNLARQTGGLTLTGVLGVTGITTLSATGKTALSFSDTTTTTGLTIGGDTNLYRDSANVLKTDDALTVTGALSGSSLGLSGNLTLASASTITWNADTTLARRSAQFLEASGSGSVSLGLYQTSTASTSGGQLFFYSDGGATHTALAGVGGFQAASSAAGGYLALSTHNGTSYNERARLDKDGNFFVGLTGTATGKINLPSSTGEANGITFGVDANRANLYRSANDTLKTDDALTVTGTLVGLSGLQLSGDLTLVGSTSQVYFTTISSSTSKILVSRVTGDTQDRFTIAASGSLAWSDGASASDVSISRPATGFLRAQGSATVQLMVNGAPMLNLTSTNIAFFGAGGSAQSTGWSSTVAPGGTYKTALTYSSTLQNVIDYVMTLKEALRAYGLVGT